MADQARGIVEENKMSDRITIINQKAEVRNSPAYQNVK